MMMSGTGIVTPIALRINKWATKTELAVDWTRSSSGNYVGSDRGATNDRYEADVTIAGYEYYVNNVLSAIEANRAADNHILTLSQFNQVDDLIFGADVNCSGSLNVTVRVLDGREQKGWHVHSVKMTLRALAPTFTGTATLPTLQYVERGYKADATWTMNKMDTYSGVYTYQDREYDAGEWQGDVVLSTANMRNLRRYLATQRTATISVPDIAGVLFPYGRRTTTYPLSCKVLECKDKGMFGKGYWIAALRLAEVVAET